MTSNQVRDLDPSPAEKARASNVLAAAFHDDPMMQYLLASAARRKATLPKYFASALRQSEAAGRHRVVTDGHGSVQGAALTMPPGAYPLPLLPQLREWRTMLSAGVRSNIRHLRELPAIDSQRPTFDYSYLMFLGVHPSAQGAGFGSLLLRAVLADAADGDLPVYLVTMQEANVGFYAEFGFEVQVEMCMGKSGPATWTMLSSGPPRGPVASQN